MGVLDAHDCLKVSEEWRDSLEKADQREGLRMDYFGAAFSSMYFVARMRTLGIPVDADVREDAD